MAIRARKLKEGEIPEKTGLYEVRDSCNIAVEEKQADNSCDWVILEYDVESGDVGYFAKEYRPAGIQKTGAKVIDITAVLQKDKGKCVRWHLYDIKDTLAGEHTVVQLYNQWNFGLQYLQQSILDQMPEHLEIPNLGVITRYYDEERMQRLRNDYQKQCDEIENGSENIMLSQQKKRPEIGKCRGILKAAKAILDRRFQTEDECNTYKIHIKQMICEEERIYKIRFSV